MHGLAGEVSLSDISEDEVWATGPSYLASNKPLPLNLLYSSFNVLEPLLDPDEAVRRGSLLGGPEHLAERDEHDDLREAGQ